MRARPARAGNATPGRNATRGRDAASTERAARAPFPIPLLAGTCLLAGACLLDVSAGAARAFAQSTPTAPGPASRSAADAPPPGTAPPLSVSDALEGALLGESYRLGPGDEIAISVWGEMPLSHVLTVTPEGKLLVPLVGELRVDRLELPEATRRIREAVRKVYHDVVVTVTLVGLRTFQVHVVGEVERPGTYEARAVDRASSVIARAGGPTERAGTRRIEIRNADTLRTGGDLVRFERLGDLDANPLLSDGDLVLVPLLRERVWLYGAVERPGQIELAPGDSLAEMVALAGGFAEGAVVDSLVVTSYAADGVSTERMTVYAEVPGLSDPASLPRIALRSDDRIFLKRRPKYHEEHLVTVDGEVLFPGTYDIEPERTTLSALVARAGGFTPLASLEEAEMIRTAGESQPDRELERLSKVQPSEMSPEEYDYVRARSRQRQGWMAIDFVRLFREGDRTQDVLLEPGDVIRVPRRKNFVKVMGRVYRPGNVTYRPGADADYYIEEAGGFTWNARRGKVRVINGLTGQWVKKGDVRELNPGDTVWVPEKPDRDWWGIARSTVSFLTGLATIYIVVDSATGP